jgi:chromosome segregation ATPase
MKDMAALTAERDTLATTVQQLEDQLANERTARVMFDRTTKTLRKRYKETQESLNDARGDNQRATDKAQEEQALRETAEQKIESLRDRVREEKERRVQAEEDQEEYRITTKAKFAKARAFYKDQKKLLQLQLEGCATEEQETIMNTFEEEYSEIGEEHG